MTGKIKENFLPDDGYWDSQQTWVLSKLDIVFVNSERNGWSFAIRNRIRFDSNNFSWIICNCIFTILTWWSIGSLTEDWITFSIPHLPPFLGRSNWSINFAVLSMNLIEFKIWLWKRKKHIKFNFIIKITLCRIWTYDIGFWRPTFYRTELRALFSHHIGGRG